jgi:hypothetical protein
LKRQTVIWLKVNDPEVQRQLEMALKVMDEYEETLRILAK